MGALSDTPPTLTFDAATLRQWGYIWRVGTKVRKKAQTDDDEPEEDSEATEADAVVSADEGQVEAVAESAVVQAAALVEDGGSPADAVPAMEVVTGAGDVLDLGAKALTLTAEQAGVPPEVLALFRPDKKYASAFSKKQGMDFGVIFDQAVGDALAAMLGGIPVVRFAGSKKAEKLLPPKPDCVEVGPARIIGGVRPQNFDVAYRPDGVRIAYDSKTLNDASSIQKNWQNMVNDLGTEATTVHTRFPYAVVSFIVAVPKPALRATQQADLIRTLERLGTRRHVMDQAHLAESIALIVWDPLTGEIDQEVPPKASNLRHEHFTKAIYECYVERYKGLPPHDK